ncbi:DUF1653 domain-containing protein [Aliidiomarina indica]|uniref:DUF1653 domain-containing protein n=1 Tax=Aliidiomarina indica TaxID=2749147 RepID=UPI0038B2BEC0
MSLKPSLQIGYYRHYKGAMYRVLDLVRHSETDEWLVLYHPCYGDRGLWVRPYTMFIEHIEHEGKRQPRFAHIPAYYDPEAS